MSQILENANKIVIESHFGEKNEEITKKLKDFDYKTIIEGCGIHDLIYAKKE